MACRVDELAIIAQAYAARGMARVHGSVYARPIDPEPAQQKPAEAAGLHFPAGAGKQIDLAIMSFPYLAA